MKVLSFRKILLSLWTLLFALCICGCSLSSATDLLDGMISDPAERAYRNAPHTFVKFLNIDQKQEVYIPTQDILNYESEYAECNGTWFKNTLSGEDLCIYNAYLYAMEHSYQEFQLYVADNQKDFHHVREAVCLDSPFLEQNTNQDGEQIFTWSADRFGQRIAFRVEQFTADRWALKLKALTQCRQIVANIPTEWETPLEKMEYLYRYVCEHLEYTTYDSFSGQDYLYDAVCKGQTICDGYSNMLGLLYNLIGVECCEAMGSNVEDVTQLTPEQLKTEIGHTWVVAKIDGVFYNFDPTFEDTSGAFAEDHLLYFGFSDELVGVKYIDLDASRPKCAEVSRDFSFSDLTVQNIADNFQIQTIAEFTDNRAKNGQTVTFVTVKETLSNQSLDAFLNQYIKKVHFVSRVTASFLNWGDYSVLKIVTQPR